MKKAIITLLIICSLTLFAKEPQQPITAKPITEKKQKKFPTIKSKVAIIKLKTSDTIIYRTVNITPTEVLVIEFPKGMLLDGNVNTAIAVGHTGIIQPKVVPSPLQIRIKAMTNQLGADSNLQIKTNAGITIIFDFIITERNIASNRIIFTFPELTNRQEKEKDAFLALKVKLQQEQQQEMKKIKEQANKLRIAGNTKGFSEFFMCNEYVNREQKDLVFFTSTRICKWGGKQNKGGDIYINFYIKNRYRNFFYVKDVKVYGLKGDSKIPIEDRSLWLEKAQKGNKIENTLAYGIQFDEVLRGAVGFELQEYYKQYIIELQEESGKKRIIRLTVGF